MSDQGPRAEKKQEAEYNVSADVRQLLLRKQNRNWRRAQRQAGSPRRYWVRSQRAYCRNLIRGDLVAHRRMFGVSHKHVQPGQVPPEQE
jgi:hypothetical protein